MTTGIDVSDHQGAIDWRRVRAAGVTFAWVKATEGGSFTATSYARNIDGARRAGLRAGAYHFARPEGNDAASEAAYFLGVHRPRPGDLVPVLDYEAVPDTAWAETWVRAVYAAIGAWPIVYTYSFFLPQMRASSILGRCPLWLANYGANDGRRHDLPPPPHTWGRASVHQYTSAGSVAGIIGPVDMNAALVPLDELTYKPVPAKPPRVEYGVWVAGPIGRGRVVAWAPRGHNRVRDKTREADVAGKLTRAALAKQLPRLKYVKRRTPPVVGKRL